MSGDLLERSPFFPFFFSLSLLKLNKDKMSNNLPLGAEFEEGAPWNEREVFIACPNCHSDLINTNGDICQCKDCGFEGYFTDFAEEGRTQKDWGEDNE